MPDPIVFGFPRSTFVQIVRLVLTHKDVSYTFRDLEPEMGKPTHLALHPFNRVPILQRGDFTVYETSAIVTYVEETFDKVALRPTSPRERARMDQWISAVNSYYYPYMIYHVSHERNVFPELGIPSDEKVVAHALPKIEVGLQVVERQLAHAGAELALVVVEGVGEAADEDDERANAAMTQMVTDLEQRSRRLAAIERAKISDDDVAIRRRPFHLPLRRPRHWISPSPTRLPRSRRNTRASSHRRRRRTTCSAHRRRRSRNRRPDCSK